jgi:hypothetical protein
MSQDRKIEELNNKRVIYSRNPISDEPTIETDEYMYYENGTYECYTLFNTSAKIPTYRSLKWHFLVLYYLNEEGVEGDIVSLEDDMRYVFKFIANKENGFVTFFISNYKLEEIINEVLTVGGEPPTNRQRKIIFKDFTGLSVREKLSIVGQLIGRSKLDEETIYQCMLDINDNSEKITIRWMAELLGVSQRTIYRNMSKELKKEKQRLNEKV